MRAILTTIMALSLIVFGFDFASAQTGNSSRPVADAYELVYDRAYQELDASLFEKPAGFRSFEHKFDGKLNTAAELDSALAELMAAVDGKVLDRKATEAWKARVESGYVGVGLSLEELPLVGAEGILVAEVILESTAEDAGLQKGDRIMEVDGKSYFAQSFDDMIEAIQGPDGSFVTLTVSRGSSLIPVEVKRDLDEKIGARLSLDKPHSLFRVRWVNRNGPASLAGLKKDDIITGIAGKPAENLTMVEALKILRTEYIDEPVSLSVRRGESEVLDLNFKSGIVPDWSLSMSYEGQGGGDPTDLRYNRFIMGVKNLDYAAFMDDFHDDFIKDYPGGIMDFRGADGNDVELAVKFIATFHKGGGELLRLKERVNSVEVETVYFRNSDGEIVRQRGSETQVVFADLKPVEFDGKLVIIVDSNTSGTAEAVVHALSSAGRASVVGSSTAGKAELVAHYNLNDVSAISYDSARLLMPDGSPMQAVSTDRMVVVSDNAMDTALNELSGKSRYQDIEVITFIGILIVGGILMVVVLLGRKRRPPALVNEASGGTGSGAGAHRHCGEDATQCTLRQAEGADDANAQTQADVGEADHPEDGCCRLDATDDEAGGSEDPNTPDLKKRSGSAYRWLWLLPLAFIGLVFIGLPLLTKQMHAPPAGASSKVTVEFFTDGSPETLSQKAVIDQLASEYSGAIEFRTVNIVQDPNARTVGSDREIKNAPLVIVTKQWLDANGKQLSMHSSSGRKIPKRNLVPMIERAAESNQDGWPDTPIQRTRNVNP